MLSRHTKASGDPTERFNPEPINARPLRSPRSPSCQMPQGELCNDEPRRVEVNSL